MQTQQASLPQAPSTRLRNSKRICVCVCVCDIGVLANTKDAGGVPLIWPNSSVENTAEVLVGASNVWLHRRRKRERRREEKIRPRETKRRNKEREERRDRERSGSDLFERDTKVLHTSSQLPIQFVLDHSSNHLSEKPQRASVSHKDVIREKRELP